MLSIKPLLLLSLLCQLIQLIKTMVITGLLWKTKWSWGTNFRTFFFSSYKRNSKLKIFDNTVGTQQSTFTELNYLSVTQNRIRHQPINQGVTWSLPEVEQDNHYSAKSKLSLIRDRQVCNCADPKLCENRLRTLVSTNFISRSRTEFWNLRLNILILVFLTLLQRKQDGIYLDNLPGFGGRTLHVDKYRWDSYRQHLL